MIVGVSGNEGSGKSTVCKYLEERHGFVRASLTAPMNRLLQELYGFTDEQLSGSSKSRNEPHPTIPGLTARKGQKALGMLLRELHQGTLVEALFRRHEGEPRVCIENVRFPDEIEAVRARGGKLIRVRGGIVSDHPTETAQLTVPDSAFDAVLPFYATPERRFQLLDALMWAWEAEAAQ